MRVYWGHIGIMEKKMETTIYWDNEGIITGITSGCVYIYIHKDIYIYRYYIYIYISVLVVLCEGFEVDPLGYRVPERAW